MEPLLHPWSRSMAVWALENRPAVDPVRRFDLVPVTISNCRLE